MHTGLKTAALLLLIATAGCRSRGELDLAERDLRLQENRIYKLQDYVQQYQMMLEESEEENAKLRKQLAEQGRTPETSGSSKPRTLRDMLGGDSNKRKPSPTGPSLTLPITPDVDLGTEFEPMRTSPSPVPSTTPMRNQKPEEEKSSDRDESSTAPRFTPSAPAELPEPDELPAPSGAGVGVGSKASQLAIRAIGQVGANNNVSGEQGLLVVVEPRSAAGGSVRAPQGATMSIMLVTGEGENVLGRWDYSEDDTAAAYRAGFGGASSWRFVLPFMKDAGTPTKLKLYVRMVMPDGSKLLSDREFDTTTGASVEELPTGNAGWSRSRRPLAAISEFIGREFRTASRGFQPARQSNQAPSFGGSNRASGGNQAPAWQLQELQPPAVSAGSASTSSGNSSSGSSANVARRWDASERAAMPLEAQSEPNQTNRTPAAQTASESGRPSWSPYR